MSGKQQLIMRFPRALHGTLRKKGEQADLSFPGLWKVSDPTLFRVTLLSALVATVLGNCGPPPILQFASPIRHVNETKFEVGSVLRYTCRPGYSRLSSNQVLVCASDGQWVYNVFCIKRRCGNPGELPNGEVEVKTDLSLGSHIKFSCLEGYVLVGSTTSYCEVQDKGVDWSDPLPQCVIAKCEAPPDISNGKHSGGNKDMYEYGASVTYSCDPHFSLIGKASISCTVENKTAGVWSSSPPACKRINCPQPKVPHGNIVSGYRARHIYKDSIVFECQKGFILRGSNLIHCEEDNKWNPSPPTCEPYSCTGLPDIPYASWGYPRPRKEERYAVGTVFKYHCHPGYKPRVNEHTTVTCQENLRWTPYKGCKESCCPIPDLKDGEILHHRKHHRSNDCVYFYGDEVSYTCSMGNKMSAVCQADGTWSPQTPACDDSCNIPPTIAHGHHTGVQTSMFSLSTTYKCEEGYTLVGEAKLTCRSSLWSPSPPQCKAQCVKPEIVNGKLSVDKDQYNELENISIHCDSGHNRIGPQIITCLENRTWYPELPKCEWEVAEGCEQVLAGRKLMQCLPNPEDVKMALELYKLSLEIDLLELQRDKARMSTLETEL